MAGLVVRVTSLKALQKSVKKSGALEGVKVVIGPELQKLCDAPGICKLLHKMAEEQQWTVAGAGLDKLEPFAPVARAVNNANRRVIDVTDLLDAKIVFNMSKHHAKIRRAAFKLKKAAGELFDTNLEPIKILGHALNDAAEEVLKDKKPREQLIKDLVLARKYCAQVYNSKMLLDQADAA